MNMIITLTIITMIIDNHNDHHHDHHDHHLGHHHLQAETEGSERWSVPVSLDSCLAHCTLPVCTVHTCTLQSPAQCTVHTVHCTPVHCKAQLLHTAHCTVHSALHTTVSLHTPVFTIQCKGSQDSWEDKVGCFCPRRPAPASDFQNLAILSFHSPNVRLRWDLTCKV